MDIFAEREGINDLSLMNSTRSNVTTKTPDFKEIQFKNFRKNRCIIYAVISTISFLISALYIYNASMACHLNLDFKDGDNKKLDRVYNSVYLLDIIIPTILIICLTLMGYKMMKRLRYRFHGLYTDYSR